MYILIDLEIDAVELAEPNDTHRFHVAVVNGDEDDKVDEVLTRMNVGRLDPDDDDHCWILAGVVRELADGRVHGTWSEDFDRMLEHGKKKGWYDAGSGEIKAHVEWIDDEDELGD